MCGGLRAFRVVGPYRYFIINGSEKVLIAMERMANNFVYCFQKKQPAKYTWICEVILSLDGTFEER